MGRFDDKVVLITGTGGGQGRVAAQRFAQEGAIVVGCDVKEDGNAETIELVRQAGGRMTGTAPLDLGDSGAASVWVEKAAGEHGRIDVLYNNASAPRFGPIDQISDEDWHFTIRNELDLVFYVTRAAWPHLASDGGVIVNIGSIQGLNGTPHSPGSAHAAAKGAVIALTRQLAAEGAPHGIRAVCISPGPIETPGTAELLAVPEVRQGMLAAQLVGRLGQPADVVELALHVASDAGGFITGANFVVDGGWTAI